MKLFEDSKGKDDGISLSDYLCTKLGRLVRRIHQVYERELSQLGITRVQSYVLLTLFNEDGLKIKELAERTGLDSSALTGILDRLEKSGFVQRVMDQEDRRSINICLTPQGSALCPKTMEIFETFEEMLLKGVTAEELGVLERVLRAFEVQMLS